ncbi:MAG TPA: NAD-dependent epimerase/dehydratase family protein [Caulobacteraceae bacterium]|jgi:nucleoside-diphosphate-sugar epimerase
MTSLATDRFPGLTGEGARRLAHSDLRIVVVGAGGWLGLATLELLHRLLGADFHRRVRAFGSNSRTLQLRGGIGVEQSAAQDLRRLAPAPSLVLHLAYLTQEKAKGMSVEAYEAANRAISANVLEALDPIGAVGVFVASSGAAYAADDPDAATSLRLYGNLKREDERAFAAWAEPGDRRAAIARIFNLSGPYINKTSSYALACFIADVLAKRPVCVAATKPVHRSYVPISQLMSVVFGVLTDDRTGPVVFDTAGERAHEIGEVAAEVAATLGGDMPVLRRPLSSDAADRYVGDGVTYDELRLRYDVGSASFTDQILETAQFMTEFLPTLGADQESARDE